MKRRGAQHRSDVIHRMILYHEFADQSHTANSADLELLRSGRKVAQPKLPRVVRHQATTGIREESYQRGADWAPPVIDYASDNHSQRLRACRRRIEDERTCARVAFSGELRVQVRWCEPPPMR
jgi:hypothetical protein